MHKTSSIPTDLISPDAVRSRVVAYAMPDVNNEMYKRIVCQNLSPVLLVVVIVISFAVLSEVTVMSSAPSGHPGGLSMFPEWLLYCPIAVIVLGLWAGISSAFNNIQKFRSTVFVLTTKELVVFVRDYRTVCGCSPGAQTKSIPLENITDASTDQRGRCGYQQDLLHVDTASSRPGRHEATIFGFEGIPEFRNMILAQRDMAKAELGGLDAHLRPTLLGEPTFADKLRELHDLVNQGILTEQEFNNQKEKILATMA